MAHDAAGKWIGYGVGDSAPQVAKIQHRLIYAYPKNSHAIDHGVIETGTFDTPTQAALIDLTTFDNTDPAQLASLKARGIEVPLRNDGIADYNVQLAIGAAVKPKLGPKYPMQGVNYNSNAFLAPDPMHTYIQAITEAQTEGVRLYSLEVGEPIIPIGYSMGGDSVKMFMRGLRPEWRPFVKAVVTFGDPSHPLIGTGNLVPDVPGADGPGYAISRDPHDEWYRDRLLSFGVNGDWYPRCRTQVLALLYQILIRASLTIDFATYLFTVLPTQAGQVLLGQQPSDDPAAGALAGLAGHVTTGPVNVIGEILNPVEILALLPELIELMTDAITFAATSAHGMYGDPQHAFWDGKTAVDYAVEQIQQRVPGGAKLYLFAGTWATWNQGFQFDTAMALQ